MYSVKTDIARRWTFVVDVGSCHFQICNIIVLHLVHDIVSTIYLCIAQNAIYKAKASEAAASLAPATTIARESWIQAKAKAKEVAQQQCPCTCIICHREIERKCRIAPFECHCNDDDLHAYIRDIIPLFHHFYMSFACNYILLMLSFAFIASYDYYIGIKLTVDGISCEIFIRHTCQSKTSKTCVLLYFQKAYRFRGNVLVQLLFFFSFFSWMKILSMKSII